ncbi:MAG: ABC transporter ATP-binding protein, partial [candidate division Zixibacteria bacterium]|nr:ABC transporter ATP-binding protein [candidate division Zixibacteria bacterium]
NVAGLVLKNIGKRFGDQQVLDGISLELGERELLVLLGPSGCGKSTVLRLIAGLEEADQGEILIDNRRVEKLRPRDRNVALVFQNYSLYPHMTVEKNLAFPLQVARVKSMEIKTRVRQVAEMLGLGDRLKDRPGQLSGGQRQRVALGRAIIRDPAIFLLDEPLSNLDAELRVRMRQEIVQLQRRLGRPMIHVTHDQSEALTMADRIALLNHGRIEQLGTPEELYTRPASRFVAEFIGTPKINLIDARIENGRLEPIDIVMSSVILDAVGHSGQVVIGIRPEAVQICQDGGHAAVVSAVEYLGDHYVVTLECNGQRLLSSLAMSPPQAGEAVRFSVDARQVLFFDSATGARLPHE